MKEKEKESANVSGGAPEGMVSLPSGTKLLPVDPDNINISALLVRAESQPIVPDGAEVSLEKSLLSPAAAGGAGAG